MTTIESDVGRVGQSLARAFERLIAALPHRPTGPQRLADALGLDKGLISRLLKAIACRDPIAVTNLIPGPDPLRRILSAAEKLGVEPELIRAAGDAVAQFGVLIRTLAHDRATFDGVVSHLLPEARERFDSRVKQQLFRGFSQLKGYSVDVDFTANFVHPATEPGHLDYATVEGVLGLRRLRPNALVRIASRIVSSENSQLELKTLGGEPLHEFSAGRLDRFCTAPSAEVSVEEFGGAVYCCISGSAFGPDAAADLVLGHHCRLKAELYSPPGNPRWSGVGVEVDKPAKLLHCDTFVHESVYAGSEPELFIFDTTFRGAANMNDPSRVPDRLDMLQSVQYLGRGFGRVRAGHIENYLPMLNYAMEARGWKPDEFRAYRVAISHPIYGTQVTIGFKRPPAPTTGAIRK